MSDANSAIHMSQMPQHIAIILDGNGRWAQNRSLPRVAGHTRGVDAVRITVEACLKRHISHLTLFAFSSENWKRPQDEISFLMHLFASILENEITRIHKNNIRLRIIGDVSSFDERVRQLIHQSEMRTALNTAMTLSIAANYGGRWDILQATRRIVDTALISGHIKIDEQTFKRYLALADIPDPDLFIRTGGEKRISNFLLWQLAYTELYFTNLLWPDFNEAALIEAFRSYEKRERRFGRTGAQVQTIKQDTF